MTFYKKRKTQKNRKTRGGNCGCDKVSGGKRKTRGGSAYLNQVPIRNFYQYKNEALNPQDPHTVGSGRLMGNPSKLTLGGKKMRKRSRKVKGGSVFIDPLLGNGTAMNPVTSFWTSAGLPNFNGTLLGSPYTNSSINIQPVEKYYGPHNPPLV
jgi:hypothetical protein